MCVGVGCLDLGITTEVGMEGDWVVICVGRKTERGGMGRDSNCKSL